MAKQVTDPAILAQLNAQSAAPPAGASLGKPVTDPAILAQLNGTTQAAAPAAGPPLLPNGKIDLLKVLQQQTKTGAYAPPSDQPQTENNPLAMPGNNPVSQVVNTINAASAGGLKSSTLNLGDELFSGAMSPVKAGMDAASSKGFDLGKAFQENEALAQQTAQDQRNLNPQAYDAGTNLGNVALMGRAGAGSSIIPVVAKGLIKRSLLQGGAVGAAMGFGGDNGDLPSRVGSALLGGAEGASLGTILGAAGSQFAKGAQSSILPTIEDLRTAGNQGFAAARNSGVVMSQPAATNLASALKQTATDMGFVTPSGKVAGYTALGHALNLADDFGSKPVTMPQLMTMRDRVADVAGSTDPKERLVGVQLLKQFDQSVGNLASSGGFAAPGASSPYDAIQSWNTGRSTLSTAHNAQTVQNLIDRAKASGKPLGQALQEEFTKFTTPKGLTHWSDELPPGMRGYSPAEVDAIQAVAKGTPVSNAAIAAGNLAPSSIAGATLKGGAPFAIGTAVGGPTLGAAAAAGSMGLGVAGRVVARLTVGQQAELARVLTLNGGKLPKTVPASISAPVQKALGNLIVLGASKGSGVKDAIASWLSPQQPQGATP